MKWVDKLKSGMTVMIKCIHEKFNHNTKIMEIIENQRIDLEIFINEKCIPLMQKPQF